MVTLDKGHQIYLTLPLRSLHADIFKSCIHLHIGDEK